MPRLSRRLCRTLAASLSFTLAVGATEFILDVPSTIGQERHTLVATGSSLPEPLYVGWADEYHKQIPLVVIRYLPQGTGESAQDILAGSGDLGGGDAPIPDKQLKADQPILQLPSVLIGVVIVCNLPQIPVTFASPVPSSPKSFSAKSKRGTIPRSPS